MGFILEHIPAVPKTRLLSNDFLATAILGREGGLNAFIKNKYYFTSNIQKSVPNDPNNPKVDLNIYKAIFY